MRRPIPNATLSGVDWAYGAAESTLAGRGNLSAGPLGGKK